MSGAVGTKLGVVLVGEGEWWRLKRKKGGGAWWVW